MVQSEIPRVEEFLIGLQKSWEQATNVVATTRHSRTNDLTSSKALSRAIK